MRSNLGFCWSSRTACVAGCVAAWRLQRQQPFSTHSSLRPASPPQPHAIFCTQEMGWAVVPWDKKNNPYIVETLETKGQGCLVRSEVAYPSLSVRLCLRDQVKSISVSLRLSASSLLLSEQDLFAVTIHRFAQRDMEGSAYTRKAVCGAFFPFHRHVYSFHHLFISGAGAFIPVDSRSCLSFLK